MKKILVMLLAMSILFSMAACSSGSPAATGGTEPASGEAMEAPAAEPTSAPMPEPTPEPVTPAGSYKLTGLAGGSGTNLEIVSKIVEMGVKYYLFLREDGTGCMNFLEAEIPLEWDDDSITIRRNNDSSPFSIPYTYADGSLQMNTRAYSLEFSPLTNEEQTNYDVNGSGSLGGMVGMAVQGLTARLDGGLIDGLFSALWMGGSDYEDEPIPEGEPTVGSLTGVVDGVEYTILGTDLVRGGESPYIVFFFEATNISDDIRGPGISWYDAAQDGEFLEQAWDVDLVPEQYNVNYDLYPGRTVRCAYVFAFDPDGGTVGFRISSFDEDNTVLYYADPRNLSGAPAEPFVFDDGYTIPEELTALPEETDYIRYEGVELYTAEDGRDAVRIMFHRLDNNTAGEHNFEWIALQDGITLPVNWAEIDFDSDSTTEDTLRVYPCLLRTDSPVVFLVYDLLEDGMRFESARIIEVG